MSNNINKFHFSFSTTIKATINDNKRGISNGVI